MKLNKQSEDTNTAQMPKKRRKRGLIRGKYVLHRS